MFVCSTILKFWCKRFNHYYCYTSNTLKSYFFPLKKVTYTNRNNKLPLQQNCFFCCCWDHCQQFDHWIAVQTFSMIHFSTISTYNLYGFFCKGKRRWWCGWTQNSREKSRSQGNNQRRSERFSHENSSWKLLHVFRYWIHHHQWLRNISQQQKKSWNWAVHLQQIQKNFNSVMKILLWSLISCSEFVYMWDRVNTNYCCYSNSADRYNAIQQTDTMQKTNKPARKHQYHYHHQVQCETIKWVIHAWMHAADTRALFDSLQKWQSVPKKYATVQVSIWTENSVPVKYDWLHPVTKPLMKL